ncbi:MAG TPA: hypothetical protein VMY37_04380 [Thermoguttaceae bacterium]|nr:hypothetical protein [Thermoguttaceae bacterium]
MSNEAVASRRNLTLRERRTLGLTFRNLRRVLVDLQGEDPAFLDKTAEERAELVFGRLVDETPEACGAIDWENIDWQKLIETIIALIQMILALFMARAARENVSLVEYMQAMANLQKRAA